MEWPMYRDRDDAWAQQPSGRLHPKETDAGTHATLTLIRDGSTIRTEYAPRILEVPAVKKQWEPQIKILPATTEPEPSAPVSAKGRTGRLRLLLVVLVASLALSGATWYGYHWLTVGQFIVSTDDAYVRAHNTTLAAKVAGYLTSIDIEDNSLVHAGDIIARIDDGDYQLAVNSARDKVATQQATIGRLERQIVAQQASVDQAKAQLASAQAIRKQTESEFDRQQMLANKEFASRQTLEKALANRDQAIAGVENARAAVDAAKANVGVLTAQRQEAARALDERKTALAKAERDLSFTAIRAPIDGVLGNRAVQTGDYVQPGQRLASLVPLDEVFIDANFKETQLARLQPGQSADIQVDALPGDTVHGTIASVSPASGSVFSLLPPDNATGNFTKIVQRVPVRISVPVEITRQQILRPGMSVVVSVNTKAPVAATDSTTSHRLLAEQQ
jgi:membrane fusion protein (multidrug efflux system)